MADGPWASIFGATKTATMSKTNHPFLMHAHHIDPKLAQDCFESNLGLSTDVGLFTEEGVIVNADGEDFYGDPEYEDIDFSTIEGFMNYAYLLGKQDGKHQAQYEIKQALGLL